MKKILTIAAICASSIAFVGCYTPPGAPINVNPLAAHIGTNNLFNFGTFNPALVFESLSQLPQTGTLNVVGPGISFSASRNLPPGYVAQPIIPLTPDRVALVENDFLASQIYGMRNDHSSQDIILVPSNGWTITFHLAYPPSTLNSSPVVTNTVVVPPSTNSIVIPGSTNTVTSQLKQL